MTSESSPAPSTELRLDELSAEFAQLDLAQRLDAARGLADRLDAVLTAIERGDLSARRGEVDRLRGAVIALRAVAG